MQHIHYAIHDMDIVMVLLVKETVSKIWSMVCIHGIGPALWMGSLLGGKRSKPAQGLLYAQIVMEWIMLVNIDISSQLFLTTNRHWQRLVCYYWKRSRTDIGLANTHCQPWPSVGSLQVMTSSQNLVLSWLPSGHRCVGATTLRSHQL